VVNGACDRCGTPVVQKMLSQWFFKITDYAERLLADIDKVDWPEAIKSMQKNWIGKSEGSKLKFYLSESNKSIEVFTTRPDTLFGVTYLVLAPEHPLLQELESQISNWDEVKNYIEATKKKTDLQRTSLEKEKTGVELKSIKAVNPATEEEIPVWIADYALSTYGTGAVMAVPAHDERDFEFAKKFSLPIKCVIDPTGQISADTQEALEEKRKRILNGDECFALRGKLINSGEYTGLAWHDALDHITADFGKSTVQYRLRDWLVSRQRYWGAPIPIIYCESCGMVPVPEDQLPVKLPTDVDFKPTGESPLVYSKEFHDVVCPKCGKPAKRDSDTMDTFVDSSWYFFRFTDPHNDKEFAGQEQMNKWMPVDHYQGGAEHAVLHLLYARFFTKVLLDLGYLSKEVFKDGEPFVKLRNQGLILGPDGNRMSKSKGNVINPDDVVDEHGADTFRMYEMFMGPLEDAKPWSTEGIVGVKRFLDRVAYAISKAISEKETLQVNDGSSKSIDKVVKTVTEFIENSKFNTGVSDLMIAFNERDWLPKLDQKREFEAGVTDFSAIEKFVKLLAPFAPHLAEELWKNLGHIDSVHKQLWPSYNRSVMENQPSLLRTQINEKVVATDEVQGGLTQEQAIKIAKEKPELLKRLEGKEVIDIKYISNNPRNLILKYVVKPIVQDNKD
jgi:leucyl-tRNA synthetase